MIELRKKIRNLRVLVGVLLTIMVISLFFNAVGMSVLMDNEDEIARLQERSYEAKQLDEAVQYIYVNDVLFYKDANEQLIRHSTPLSLNRAVKATKLPKLIEV